VETLRSVVKTVNFYFRIGYGYVDLIGSRVCINKGDRRQFRVEITSINHPDGFEEMKMEMFFP